jgi:GNAT acetyltransferase-like protein
VARAELLEDRGAAAAGPDFFRSVELYDAERVTHSLVVEEEARVLLAAPVIVRAIDGSGLLDAVSPYGYPGAAASAERAPSAAEVDWSATGLVSVFLRGRVGEPVLPGGTLRSHVQVADPDEPLSIRTTHRRHVRRNERLGYSTRVVPGPEAGERERAAFVRLYRETMTRTEAAERYLFPDAWFATVLRSPASFLVLALDPDGREAAGAIAVRSDGMLHYYLGGTGDAFLARSPFKNAVVAMIDLARELGMPLSLGGGVRPGDELEHFKAGFANRTAPWYTHEIVCDRETYARLSAGREEAGFFPLYRAGT